MKPIRIATVHLALGVTEEGEVADALWAILTTQLKDFAPDSVLLDWKFEGDDIAYATRVLTVNDDFGRDDLGGVEIG